MISRKKIIETSSRTASSQNLDSINFTITYFILIFILFSFSFLILFLFLFIHFYLFISFLIFRLQVDRKYSVRIKI